MRTFLLKLFNRQTAVKVVIFHRDQRTATTWVVPDEEGLFTYAGGTFTVDDNPVYDAKGWPTYYFKYDKVNSVNQTLKPVNKDIKNENATSFTPQDFKTAIKSKVVNDLVKSQESADVPTITLILSAVILLGLIVGFYLIYQELTTLYSTLDQVYDLTPNEPITP